MLKVNVLFAPRTPLPAIFLAIYEGRPLVKRWSIRKSQTRVFGLLRCAWTSGEPVPENIPDFETEAANWVVFLTIPNIPSKEVPKYNNQEQLGQMGKNVYPPGTDEMKDNRQNEAYPD